MESLHRSTGPASVLALFAFAWLTVASTGSAAAAAPVHTGVECFEIDRIPFLVTEPGVYCLTRDHAVAIAGGSAIEIRADHVTLDLGGHTIDNTAAGHASTASGVFSNERGHIVVRNGTLVGFEESVALSGPFGGNLSTNHRVEGLRVVNSGETGIGITGNDSVVRGNTIHHVGIGLSSKDPVSGIFLAGYRNRAIDNDVIRVVGHPTSNVAIRFLVGSGSMAIGNRISGADTAIWFDGPYGGLYRDNLATEVSCCDPFQGGTDLGGNVWQ